MALSLKLSYQFMDFFYYRNQSYDFHFVLAENFHSSRLTIMDHALHFIFFFLIFISNCLACFIFFFFFFFKKQSLFHLFSLFVYFSFVNLGAWLKVCLFCASAFQGFFFFFFFKSSAWCTVHGTWSVHQGKCIVFSLMNSN